MSVTMLRPAPTRTAVRASPAALAALFGVLATVVSASGSWIPSLWGDESASIMSAQRPLPSLFAMLGHVDAVHGAYYLGLHFWSHFFGFSPFAVRLPSAVAAGLATAAIVLLAGRMRGIRTAVVAGLICALLPRVTDMGEEARSYAFSAAVVAWLTVLLVAALGRERPRTAWWVGYGALLAAGTCLFLYTLLFVVVHGVVLAASRPPRRVVTGWLSAVGAAFATALPLLIVAVGERHQIAYLGATQQLAPQTLFSGLWFGGGWPLAVVGWALVGVAVAAEVRRGVLSRRRSAVARGAVGDPTGGAAGGPTGAATGSAAPAGRPRPSLVLIALAWLSVPTLILIAVQPLVPVFTARYVSFCAPAAALLVACGVDELLGLRRRAGVVAGVLVIALSIPLYVGQRTPYAKNGSDWAEVSAAVGALAHRGDAVVFDESVRPSRRPRLAMHTYPAGFAHTVDVTLAVPFAENTALRDSVYSVRQAASLGRFDGVERVWLIEYAAAGSAPDGYGAADLAALGFRATGTRVTTHRALVALYERTR